MKAAELRTQGVEEVSYVVAEGKGPGEITELAKKTSGSVVAMCLPMEEAE